MSEKKIKVGDKVRVKGRTCISTVMYMKDGWVSVDTPIRTAEAYPEDDVVYVDPRTAFLQELKELLSKYNATIFGFEMWASINGEQCAFENAEYLDSDNIMDYEKE